MLRQSVKSLRLGSWSSALTVPKSISVLGPTHNARLAILPARPTDLCASHRLSTHSEADASERRRTRPGILSAKTNAGTPFLAVQKRLDAEAVPRL